MRRQSRIRPGSAVALRRCRVLVQQQHLRWHRSDAFETTLAAILDEDYQITDVCWLAVSRTPAAAAAPTSCDVSEPAGASFTSTFRNPSNNPSRSPGS